MARKISQSDPALAIDFFLSGFYTHRSQLFAPFKSIGVNVVSFHDPVIDGANMEDTDLYEWQRRPGFSIYCSEALADTEIVKDFDSFRNLNGDVIPLFDSSVRYAKFSTDAITTIFSKTTANAGYGSAIGNKLYFADGVGVDMQKWDSTAAFSSINPSPWGISAPTLAPTIFNQGCWLPFTEFAVNNAILDPNGNVEVVTAVFGTSPLSGGNEPNWPTTVSSAINDGSIQWTNMGPLLTWLPDTYYPVPVVVLDLNGNLQLATAVSPAIAEWDSGTTYDAGDAVTFGGLFWISLVGSNTGIAPSSNYTVTTVVGSTSTTQPYWIQTDSPSVTGTYSTAPYVPTWNKNVGQTTTDGNYVWTNLGPGVLIESFGTSYVFCYRTIDGHLSTASPVSLSTGSIFGPQVASITSFSISNNVVTFTGSNNFRPGQTFSVQGLGIGTYLNHQSFIVLASGLSSSEFSAVFSHADVPLTVDFGSTLNLVATITGRAATSALCNGTSSITATEIVAGVVTVYGPHNFASGIQVTFSDVVVATFLNGQQFQIVNVDPAGQWFQVYFTTDLGTVPSDQAKTTDAGTVTFNSIEIYRVSDGGGIYLFTGAVTNPTGSTIIPYDTGEVATGKGTDDGNPGVFAWTNPNNVTSATNYASVFVPTPVSGGSAFSVVQTCQAFEVGHAITTQSAAFSTNVTSGNCILVFATIYNISGGYSVTDTMGNAYTEISSKTLTMPNGAICTNHVFLATSVSGGPTTITMSISGESTTTFFGFGAAECSGLVGTHETAATNSQLAGTTMNPGSITTADANEVVFTFLWNNTSPTHNAPSQPATLPTGYTAITNQVILDIIGDNFANTYQQSVCAYQVQSAIGSYDPVWSTPAGVQSIGITFSMPLKVYAPSNGLISSTFNFAVPPGISISGIEIDFEGYFTGTVGDGVYNIQLERAGVPVGTTLQASPQNANQNFTVGGSGNLWGTTWAYSDFNATTWGVRISAAQSTGGTDATFYVRNVRARLTGSTSTTGFVFNDFTVDDNLNEFLIAPQNHQNDPPPGAAGSTVTIAGTLTRYWNGRLWMAVGNYVYFDAGPDCQNGDPHSSWPPANRFQWAGPVLNLIPSPDGAGLLVYLADRVGAILGGPETISFYQSDGLSNFGISSPYAVFKDGSTIGQYTTQKQYFELISGDKQEIGEHVSNYLSENFAAEKVYVTLHRDGLDTGVFISNGVDRILRYGNNIGAWSVPSFPIFGAGALKSIETTIGHMSLMTAPPAGGVSAAAGPQNPSLGQSTGSGLAWANPSNITDGVSTTYATLTMDGSTSAQVLAASDYILNIPETAVIQGVEVSVTAKAATSDSPASVGFGPNLINAGGGSGSTSTTVFTMSKAPISIGDTMFLMVQYESNPLPAINTVTDNKGNVWQAAAPVMSDSNGAGNFYGTQVWYAVAKTAIAVGQTLTITITYSAFADTLHLGFANASGLGDFDGYVTASGTGTVASSGNLAITESEVLVSVVWTFNTRTVGNSFVPLVGQSTNTISQLTTYNALTAGTYTDSYTQTSGRWSATLMGFKTKSTVIFDTAAFASNTSSSSVSVGPVTPTQVGDFAVFVTAIPFPNSRTFSFPAGWTTTTLTDTSDAVLRVQTLSNTGDLTATCSLLVLGTPTASSWASGVVLLKSNGSPTIIQANRTSGGIHSVTTTLNGLTAGNSILFVVTFDEWDGAYPTSLFDSQGNVLLPLGNPIFSNVGDGSGVMFFLASGIASGTDTITLTFSNVSTTGATWMYEISGLLVGADSPLVINPLNAVNGATSHVFTPSAGNTTTTFGGPADLWGMPSWISPTAINDAATGFGITAQDAASQTTFSVSEVQIKVYYQNPGNYLCARDISSWGDCGNFGENNGTSYPTCNIVLGSITLTQPGGEMFPLQHVVGYFDAVGTLGIGGKPSEPDVWILPNEINASAPNTIGFIQLSEVLPEPPTGQNIPSSSLLALRWPVNMMNTTLASQFVHHLQVKIQFEPENAPNTIKALAFKENQ